MQDFKLKSCSFTAIEDRETEKSIVFFGFVIPSQADLYAGALFITQATQIKGNAAIYIAILILLAIACIFTVAGGLTAVIWTDFVQTILMIAGALIVCIQCKFQCISVY